MMCYETEDFIADNGRKPVTEFILGLDAIRILFAYHPLKRKFILLLHGVIKKRDDLKANDIKIAEERYKTTINRQLS